MEAMPPGVSRRPQIVAMCGRGAATARYHAVITSCGTVPEVPVPDASLDRPLGTFQQPAFSDAANSWSERW